MDAPLSSQATQPDAPKIFFNSNGSPLRIFTEAGGISGRPKFIRRLKTHGASTCSDPKEAEIILVNQDTTQGRQFIRDWGTDDTKVVLHYTWVTKSIEQERPLLADDNWGGCKTRDDGLPIGEDGDEDEDIRNLLPPPSFKAAEAKKPSSRVTDYDRHTPLSQSQQSTRTSMPPPAASTSSSDSRSMTPMSVSQSQPSQLPTPAMAMQAMAMANPMAQMQFPMQMPAMVNPMMNPMMNQMLFQQMFNNMMMSAAGGQFNEDAFKVALADIVTNKMPGSQMQASTFNRQETRSPSPVPEQALPFPEVPRKSSHRRMTSESSDLPPLSFMMDKKGKHKEGTPPPKRRKVLTSTSPYTSNDTKAKKSTASTAGTSKAKIFTKSGRPLSFFVQIDLHNRFSVVDAIKKNGGLIEKDHELADYVVLYSANKVQKTFNDLLRAAHLAGKIAVPSKYIYECVEKGTLLSPSQYEFESVVGVKRKRQSTAPVIDESDDIARRAEEKRLLRNQLQNERRKQRLLEERAQAPKATLTEAAAKKAMLAEGLRKAEEKAASRVKMAKASSSAVSVANGATERPSTPPIPPEHTRKLCGQGFAFTLEERQFASNYAEILVERDHTISNNAVGTAIYKKLPHHTLGSWRTHVLRDLGKDLDAWRKRASIAFRKAQRLSQIGPSSSIVESPMDDEQSPPRTSVTPISQDFIPSQIAHPNGNSNPSIQDKLSEEEFKLLEEDDLNVISQFFAQTDDTEDEDEVWARLGSTYPCQTQSNWQEFYQKRYEEVQRRYAEIGSKEGDH